MNLIIRQAKFEDANSIAEAERAIAQRPGFFCSLPSEISDESVIKAIDQRGIYLVAVCEDQIVGHAFLETSPLKALQHVAELNIAVNLGWQNKGIGKKLLEEIIRLAKNSDLIEKIQLNVRATNLPAIALYKKMSFQEEGRLRNRVKTKDGYIDDLIMGLDLRDSSPLL